MKSFQIQNGIEGHVYIYKYDIVEDGIDAFLYDYVEDRFAINMSQADSIMYHWNIFENSGGIKGFIVL